MKTKAQQTHPSPADARERSGLSPVELAAAVPCALSTIYRCETVGEYPRQKSLRKAYFRSLGLSEKPGRIKAAVEGAAK